MAHPLTNARQTSSPDPGNSVFPPGSRVVCTGPFQVDSGKRSDDQGTVVTSADEEGSEFVVQWQGATDVTPAFLLRRCAT